MVDISFITVNYNGLAFIRELLKSLEIFNSATSKSDDDLNSILDKSNIPEWEIIIFDNNSVDGSSEFIEKEAEKNKRIVLIESKTNVGFCRGSNEGAKAASGKYLAFLNPDTKIINRDIGSLIDFVVEREKLGEKIGIVGAKTINNDGTIQYNCRAFPTIARQFYESYFLFKFFGKSRFFGSYFMTWWDHQNNMEVDWVTGSFMFIRKEIFELISGFDEDYFMYSEDTDICLRLKRKGYKNYYFAGYEIIHFDSAISSKNMVTRELGIWRSRRLYFKKNHSELFARAVSTFYFFGILNRLFLFILLFIFTFNKKAKAKILLYVRTLKLYF